MPQRPPEHILIIGAGIIGCTTAYYLSRHPSYNPTTMSITVLEASSVAGGASGKAGGLIAKWAYPPELVNITFAEHEKLASEHNGTARWGWRYTDVGQWSGRGEERDASVEITAKTSLQKKDGFSAKVSSSHGLPSDLDWVKAELTESYTPMAGPGETAQVHPYQFTTSMLALAQENGVQVILGKATAIHYSGVIGESNRSVSSVTYASDADGTKTLTADAVIVSAGPWTSTLIPSVPIYGMRAHSITIRPTRPVSAYALFTEICMPSAKRSPAISAQPEIYSRPNNEVYACSPGDDEPLPASTREVKVDRTICHALFRQVSAISPELRAGEMTVQQACYLPNVSSGPSGCPIVGRMTDVDGLFIAAGHTCWGICNAPATAKVLSEMIMEGRVKSSDVTRLAPKNFL